MVTQKPIKVLFVLPSLKAGGAERVISTIARGMDKEKFKSILVIAGYKEDAVYSTEGIETIFLGKARVLKATPLLLKLIFTKRPDIVVGSISHVNIVLAGMSILFPRTKFVGREASVGSIMKQFNTIPKKRIGFIRTLFRNYHKKLDAIICQSLDMAKDFSATYAINQEKLHVINNPISNNLTLKKGAKNATKKIITIGRLSKEKGHERLLYILEKLLIPYEYLIIGDGNEKKTIFNLAEKLRVKRNIKYIPYTSEIQKYLSESDVFIQGSFVEGFPNALLESCVVGTPVIAFNAPGGTREIIENDINGYLVDSSEEFLEKLQYSLSKKEWKSEIIRDSVIKKFISKEIINKYETIFTKLIHKN